MIILITLALLISLYFVFKKMGFEGYKAYIPFYNEYLLCKQGYKKYMYWVILSLAILGAIFLFVFGASAGSCTRNFGCGYYHSYYYSCRPMYLCLVLGSICLIAAEVLSKIATYSVVMSFGKSKGLAIFSIFFEALAFIFIGFDKRYTYTGNWQEIKKQQSAENA